MLEEGCVEHIRGMEDESSLSPQKDTEFVEVVHNWQRRPACTQAQIHAAHEEDSMDMLIEDIACQIHKCCELVERVQPVDGIELGLGRDRESEVVGMVEERVLEAVQIEVAVVLDTEM